MLAYFASFESCGLTGDTLTDVEVVVILSDRMFIFSFEDSHERSGGM